jgi:hypothetical protein
MLQMLYKVTEITRIKPVRILANVRIMVREELGGGAFRNKQADSLTWIELKRGETKDGLGKVFGIDPKYAPDQATTNYHGHNIVMIMGGPSKNAPMDILNLIRIELSDLPTV